MGAAPGSAGSGERLPTEAAGSALTAFAAAALELVKGGAAERGLAELLRAVALGTGAELIVARLAEGNGHLVARGVHSGSAALAAELQGTRIPVADVPEQEVELEDAPGDPTAPAAVRRAAARARMPIVRLVPVSVDGDMVALLELYRTGLPFGPEEEALARAAAAHVALALLLDRASDKGVNGWAELSSGGLELLGEALAAGANEAEAAEQVVRVAAEAAEAAGATLWRIEADGTPTLLATHGFGAAAPDLVEAGDSVRHALGERAQAPVRVGSWLVHTVPLGEPPTAVLRLAFEAEGPEQRNLERLSQFGVGAALALRRSRRAG
jgi:hypothetical protein